MSKQKLMIAYSAIAPSIVALGILPLLSRLLSESYLNSALIIIMMSGIFGAFDVLKPVYISVFSKAYRNQSPIQIQSSFKLSLLASGAISLIVFGLMKFFFNEKISGTTLVFVTTGGFIFLLSNVFWAVLDSTGRAGSAQAIRSSLTILLYLSFAALACLSGQKFLYGLAFALTQAAQFFFFYFFSRNYIGWNEENLESHSLADIWHTAKLNASKIAIDFFDRLAIGKLGTPAFSNAYFLIYDLTSKLNIPTQYINIYLYPILCAKATHHQDFNKISTKLSLIAAANYLLLASASVVFLLFGDLILRFYLGESFESKGDILSFLTLISANYCLAFYGQSMLRATDNFKRLSVLYLASACLGSLIGFISIITSNFNLIFLMILILKSPGVSAYLATLNTLSAPTYYLYIATTFIYVVSALILHGVLNNVTIALQYSTLLILITIFFSGVLRSKKICD